MAYNGFEHDVSYLKNCSYKKEASAVEMRNTFYKTYGRIEEILNADKQSTASGAQGKRWGGCSLCWSCAPPTGCKVNADYSALYV